MNRSKAPTHATVLTNHQDKVFSETQTQKATQYGLQERTVQNRGSRDRGTFMGEERGKDHIDYRQGQRPNSQG